MSLQPTQTERKTSVGSTNSYNDNNNNNNNFTDNESFQSFSSKKNLNKGEKETDSKTLLAKEAESFSVSQLQTSGLLAVASVFLLVEGSTRITLQTTNVINNGADGPDGPHVMPPAILLSASVAEVVFGFAGFFVGMSILLFGKGHRHITLLALVIEQLGWWTFVVFTLAHRIVTYTGTLPGLNKGESNFAIACNVFGSVCYCASLQGTQWFLTFKLWRSQKGDSLLCADFYRYCGIFATSITMLCALGQWWVGALVLASVGNGRLQQPIALPFITVYPELNVFVGLCMTVWAFYAYYGFITFRENEQNDGSTKLPFNALWFFTFVCWIVQICCMGWVQNSYINLSWLTATLTGNTFLICFLPAYCDGKMRTAF
eukprot:Pgem_evm1s12136